MKRLLKLLSLALLAMPFIACDNNVVPRAKYDAAVAYSEKLEARNDSLEFELSDLELYNEYLEKRLDSLEQQR